MGIAHIWKYAVLLSWTSQTFKLQLWNKYKTISPAHYLRILRHIQSWGRQTFILHPIYTSNWGFALAKVGYKSGEVVGKAWVFPACHLWCFSTESDISSEHPPNTEHCERSHCYTGGKEKLPHILLCMGDVAVFIFWINYC